jgi:sterol 3beta-glucosyltransferase
VRRVRALDRAAVYGYSSLLSPLGGSAAAKESPEGRSASLVTGFWFLPRPEGWQPNDQLRRFLEAGPSPIYVGFGSNLTGREPHRLTELYVNAIKRIGGRGIFYAGWGDFADIPLPDSILRVESVPHDWLFARVAAVVHHGGAGSTSAATAAGAPSVAMPFLGDQFFWARQIHALGCGPPPLDRKTLTVEHLAETLADLVDNRTYRQRAQALGARLLAESGADKAAEWIEQQFTSNVPAGLTSETQQGVYEQYAARQD